MRQHLSALGAMAIGVLSIALVVSTTARSQDDTRAQIPHAGKIIDDWQYPVDGDNSFRKRVGNTGDGPHTTFATCSVRLTNVAYEDAWHFYAMKCNAGKKYSPRLSTIANVEAENGDRFSILRWPSNQPNEDRPITMFTTRSSHYAATVHLMEAEGRTGKKELHVQIAVATY